MTMRNLLTDARHTLITVLGLVALLVSTGFLNGQALAVALGILSAATAAGVYTVNDTKTPPVVDTGPGAEGFDPILAAKYTLPPRTPSL